MNTLTTIRNITRAAGTALVLALGAVCMPCGSAMAQSSGHDHSHTDGTGKRRAVAPSYAWKLLSPLGLRQPASIDTLFQNYAREFVPSEVSAAWVTTGNLGSEGMNMIFD
ncbi:MAG: hypothetical protein K2F79_03615, partial [Muribaculaceae bacterium]|nr:hypothetical protein [Muribaculaceae bacterium]